MRKLENVLAVPLQEGTRLEGADIVDEVIWSKLSRFWSDGYNPENKDALTAIYLAYADALNAEYVRLFEINKSKGILDCPVYAQRRWLRLDFSLYPEVKKFLQFLLAGTAQVEDAQLSCTIAATNHPRHWHFSFSISLTSNIIPLHFTTNTGLVEVYNADGKRLAPRTASAVAWDYEVKDDALLINAGVAGETYYVVAGFDFTNTNYKPVMYTGVKRSTYSYSVPASFTNGLPFHVLVKHEDGAETYVGNATHGANGFVILPITTLNTDIVYIFGKEAGAFDIAHTHKHAHVRVLYNDVEFGVVSSVQAPEQVSLGIYGALQVHQLFVDGVLLAPDAFTYNYPTNTYTLKQHIILNSGSAVNFDFVYTYETAALVAQLSHIHSACNSSSILSNTFARFDDGGEFDDGGVLDDAGDVFTVELLDAGVSVASLSVFVNGKLLQPDVDYSVGAGASSLFVTFVTSVTGSGLLITYRRDAFVYAYGMSDIKPYNAVFNIDVSILSATINNIQDYIVAYEKKNGQLVNKAVCIEAAKITAAGGNPMLALFADEFRDYAGINMNAPGYVLTAEEARTVESLNTSLVAIPVLTDYVYNPSVRLESDYDFKVVDGEVWSTVELRNNMWCPLVLLDERTLAGKFGRLIGHVKDSSSSYKNELVADLLARYSGFTVDGLASTAAIALGSPVFKNDGVVQGISEEAAYKTVSISNGSKAVSFKFAADASTVGVGEVVVTGQSLCFPAIFNQPLSMLVGYNNGVLVLAGDYSEIQVGDTVRISLSGIITESTTKAVGVKYVLAGAQTTITFDAPAELGASSIGHMRVYRDCGPPYIGFDGFVSDITTHYTTSLSTDAESIELKVPAQHRAGDMVNANTPVLPNLATCFDAQSRPDWWKVTGAFVKPVNVTSYLSFTTPTTAHTIEIEDGSVFPAAGKFVTTGNIEATYTGKSGNRLLGVEWLLPTIYSLSAGATINCRFAHLTYIPHPALTTAIRERVKPAILNNNETLYNLLKNTVTVLELNGLYEPGHLANTIADVKPTGTSVITVLNKVETIPISLRASTTLYNKIETDYTVQELPDGATNPSAYIVTLDVTDADSTEHTFDWNLEAIPAITTEYLTPQNAHSTVLHNVKLGVSYKLSYTVTNDVGNTTTGVIEI